MTITPSGLVIVTHVKPLIGEALLGFTLFPNTKPTKNNPQQIIRRKLAGNRTQPLLGKPQFLGEQIEMLCPRHGVLVRLR